MHDRFNFVELNSMASHGIAIQKAGSDNQPMIAREQTTYQLNLYGFGDDAYTSTSYAFRKMDFKMTLYRQIATELAHDLDHLIEARHADGDAGQHQQVQTASTTALHQYLWAKCVPILNVLKAHANSERPTEKALAALRAAVTESHTVVERLHDAVGDPAALRGLLDELDMIVTDLDAAVELISDCPPLLGSTGAAEDEGGLAGPKP